MKIRVNLKHILQNLLHQIDISLYYTGEVKWLSTSGEKTLKNIKPVDLVSEGLEFGQKWKKVDKIKDNALPISVLFASDVWLC